MKKNVSPVQSETLSATDLSLFGANPEYHQIRGVDPYTLTLLEPNFTIKLNVDNGDLYSCLEGTAYSSEQALDVARTLLKVREILLGGAE